MVGRLPQNIFSLGCPDDKVLVNLTLSDTPTFDYSTDIPR